jgi:hypothetical protein
LIGAWARRFEERFSSLRMANDCLEVYRRLGRSAKLVPDHAASALGSNIIPLHTKTAAWIIMRVEARPQTVFDATATWARQPEGPTDYSIMTRAICRVSNCATDARRRQAARPAQDARRLPESTLRERVRLL